MGYVKIEIDKKTGEIKIEGIDFFGNECVAPLEYISSLIGETIDVEPKSDALVRVLRRAEIKTKEG